MKRVGDFLKRIYLMPFAILMGNMGGGLARMQREAEEAEKALLEGIEPEKKGEPEPDKAGVPEKTDPEPEKTPVPEKQEPDIAALQAEVARLTELLADENSQTWKQKYATLQGMFNAETAKLRSDMDALKQQVEAKPEPAPAPADTVDYETLKTEVGEKTANILKPYLEKIASLETTLSQVSGEVKTTKERTVQVAIEQAQTAEDQFFSRLGTIAPDWKDINGWDADGKKQDSRFAAFMHQTVPGTTFTYQKVLNFHYGRRDAGKVAEVFDLFKKSVGMAEPPKPKEDDPPKPTKAAPSAEEFIEPDKTGKGSNPPSGHEEIIPQAEYDAFVASITKGTFKGTREERLKLEARYDKAFAENRIR